jgi:putative spermidine/putrescine transport system permease protein
MSHAVALPGRRGAPAAGVLRKAAPVLLLLPAALVVGFFFATLFSVVQASFRPSLGPGIVGTEFTLANYAAFIGSPFYRGFLLRSLFISAYCTAITAVLGYVIAYAMYRASPRARIVAGTILILQFFTAYVIRTYAVMLVIGKNGVLNRTLLDAGLIDAPLNLLFTETGVAIGMVMVSLPFMVFPILNALQAIPHSLELAATSLGAGRTRVFWQVVFPLSLPGLGAGIVVVFLFELTSYIVPGALGGGYVDMMANLIYAKAMQSFDHPFASAAAIVMLLVSAGCLYLLQKGLRLLLPRT